MSTKTMACTPTSGIIQNGQTLSSVGGMIQTGYDKTIIDGKYHRKYHKKYYHN